MKNNDLSKKGGLCLNLPGMVIFELEKMVNCSTIEIGGYSGDKKLWFPENGVGAEIMVSEDN